MPGARSGPAAGVGGGGASRHNRAMSSNKSDDDLTRVLDGCVPATGLDGAKLDPSLPQVDELQPRRRLARPDPESARLPKDLDLDVPTRYSKWNSSDVSDVDAVWKRGAQVGAVKSVFDSVARVVSTAQAPVVDACRPQVLLSPMQPDEAGAELLKCLPPQAEPWLGEHDIDWGLVGEAVLPHEPGLRDFQLKELRTFVDAERQCPWERANKAYKLPASGQPIERI